MVRIPLFPWKYFSSYVFCELFRIRIRAARLWMNNSFDLIGLQKGLKLFTIVQINSFRCAHCLCTMETICIRNSIKIPTILYRFLYMALAYFHKVTGWWVYLLCWVMREWKTKLWQREYTTSNFLSLTSLLLASCLRKHAHWFWHFLSGQDILTYSSCLRAPTCDVRSTNSGWLQTG